MLSLNDSNSACVITTADHEEIFRYIRYTNMTDREISIQDEKLIINENVETVYEKTVTPFGNSRKVDVSKKYLGRRIYVIVPKG